MTTYDRSKARQWLREMRGDVSQADLAADITATTGWNITRDRYSKYESGSPTTPMGREVFQRFVDYWTSKGRPEPDMTTPAPELSIEERALRVAEAQVEAIREQTEVMRQLLGALTAAATTAAPAGTSPIEAVVSQVIGRSALPLPTETHAPTG